MIEAQAGSSLARRLDRLARAPWLVPAVFAAGLVARLVWLRYGSGTRLSIGEALNVAHAIWQSGTIADAFKPGQGPTAHVMPIPPLIAAGVYRLLGFQTFAAEAVLTAWSLVLVFASFALVDRSFGRMGSPPMARVAALAFLCLVPLNFSLETIWFRVWDGALAVALAAAFLYLLVAWDGSRIGVGRVVAASLLLAVLFFVQPNFGVAGIVCAALFIIRNLPPRRWAGSVAIAAVAAAIVFAPWTIRNIRVMGSPIVLRDNLGLEMALAFHPAAAATTNPARTFFVRHKDIHPYENGPGFAAMQRAGGEVAYAQQLSHDSWVWIGANPAAAARLAVRHLVETLFPPAWYWTMFSEGSSGTVPKMLLNWAISALGLAGIAVTLRADRRYHYAAIMTLVTILPFALVQPTIRYRYLIVALLVFFAAEFVAWCVVRVRSGPVRSSSRSPAAAP